MPFELRNDFASIALDGETHAGAVRVLDETDKRRRVGLLSQTPGRSSAAAAVAALLHPPRPGAFCRSGRTVEPGPDGGDPATAGAKAGGHRDGRCRNRSRKHAQAADRLDGKRRHAGALRQLAAAERRQRRGTAAGQPAARRTLAWRHAVVDAAADGGGVPAQWSVLQPPTPFGRHRDQADPRRTDAGPCRPYLGDARRRHSFGDRRPARQRHGRAVPRHAAGNLVEPADLRNLRGDAPPDRATIEKPGCGRRKFGNRCRRFPAALPHDLGRWRAGAAWAGSQAAGNRQGRAAGDGRKSAWPLWNRSGSICPQSAAGRHRPHARRTATDFGPPPDRALCVRRVAGHEGTAIGGSADVHGARQPDRSLAGGPVQRLAPDESQADRAAQQRR